MSDLSVVYYHPLFWKHIDRLLKQHRDQISPIVLEKFYNEGYGSGAYSGKHGTGEFDLNHGYYNSAWHAMYWIGKLLDNHSPINRLNFLNKIKVGYSSIPTGIENFNKTFKEICFERAGQLWAQYKDITVFWSGGLDSTCLALVMLETKPVDGKLVLVGTPDSICEYENFYNQFKHIIKIVDKDKLFDLYYLTTTETTVITGEAGDQIFCGAIADEFENKDRNWKDVITTTLVNRLKNPLIKKEPAWNVNEQNHIIRSLDRIVSVCPIKINRYIDFLWWLTFTTKMNYVTHKFPTLIADHNLGIPSQTRLDTFLPFYLSDDFQLWSMANQQVKMPGGPETYKQPIKDLIIDLFGDPEFIKNKGKELSTIKTVEENWHTNWIKNENVNYVRLSDGSYYSKANDLPVSILEDLILNKNG